MLQYTDNDCRIDLAEAVEEAKEGSQAVVEKIEEVKEERLCSFSSKF